MHLGDYVKVGLPLLLLTMLVTVALVSAIYSLSGTQSRPPSQRIIFAHGLT
jgi:hypothetical protein